MLFFKPKKTSMEKEIFEQSDILAHLFETYVSDDGEILVDVPKGIEHIVFVASGSSYNSARYAADLFGDIASIEARAIYSSEFLLKSAVPHATDMMYVFITQSGETSDTNKALSKAKEFGVTTFCITNKKDSTIWQASDFKMDCHAGEELSIAATKSLTAQMFCLAMLVLKYAKLNGIDITPYLKAFSTIGKDIEKSYALMPQVKKFAKHIARYKNVVIAADGISYALAREACLKTKETSYINISSAILGEFMHGHVAVLNNKSILIYITNSELNYTAIKNLNKIKEEYKTTMCILGSPNDKIKTEYNLNVDCESSVVKSFCLIVIAQMLAMEVAKCLHRNVDKPHGLHKVVK
ncbi:MAG: SIS domain-containing protein [Clostridiaceae bacterium]|nr:SIS domain-containing protein [Clostridiaceae bacterium]